jgi:hypothetical protein
MRQFEFRAWENGKMYYQVRCGGVFDGIPTAPTVWSEAKGDWLNLTGQPHTKIMQYTGLMDDTGKRIYEGDIVKVIDGKRENISEVFIHPIGVYIHAHPVVKKLTGKEIEYLYDYCDFGNGRGITQRCYVIGNKYDDPELIK